MAELLRRIGRSKHILLKKRACELKRNRERESQELCVVYYVSIGERERERERERELAPLFMTF